jgi:hypothetical protein
MATITHIEHRIRIPKVIDRRGSGLERIPADLF